MGPGAADAEGGGCHGEDENPCPRLQVLHASLEVSKLKLSS